MSGAVLIAGPNGAGKSTTAPRLPKLALGVVEFITADLLASGLSPFVPRRLRRLELLTLAGESAGCQFDGTCQDWNTGWWENFLTFLRKLYYVSQAVLGGDSGVWCRWPCG